MPDLFIFLLLGHYFGDFVFQTDYMARNKAISKKVLSFHVFIYTLTIAFFLVWGLMLNNYVNPFSMMTPIILIVLYLEHWLQDFYKGIKFNGSRHGFFVDQGIHIMVLFLIRLYVYHG